jgi:hypothetical protein
MKIVRNLVALSAIVVAATIGPEALRQHRPLEKAFEFALEALIQIPADAGPELSGGTGGPYSNENSSFINPGSAARCFPTAESPTLKCIPRDKHGQICQVGDCLPDEFDHLPSLDELEQTKTEGLRKSLKIRRSRG